MQYADIRIMRGPNYYSATHNRIIVAKLSIPEAAVSENLIQEVDLRLSEGVRNAGISTGQISDLLHGLTLRNLPELVAAVAMKLQQTANIGVFHTETQKLEEENTFRIICEYEFERAGFFAVEAALRLVADTLENKPHDVGADILKVNDLYYSEHLGPSTTSITSEAIKRGIPVIGTRRSPFIQLGYGAKQKRVSAALTSETGAIGVDIAGNKDLTKEILDTYGIPVPK
jgi:cyanophycin synthetase